MIIFVNGTINAGKSTVAKMLAERLGKTALVEIDKLREFVEWMPIKEAVPISLENAVSVVGNFAKRGIDCVVPYPLSEENYLYLVDKLRDYGKDLVVVTLVPGKEVVLQNRGGRELNSWEKERVEYHYGKMGIVKFGYGKVVDNSDQTPEETVDEVFEYVERKMAGLVE